MMRRRVLGTVLALVLCSQMAGVAAGADPRPRAGAPAGADEAPPALSSPGAEAKPGPGSLPQDIRKFKDTPGLQGLRDKLRRAFQGRDPRPGGVARPLAPPEDPEGSAASPAGTTPSQ